MADASKQAGDKRGSGMAESAVIWLSRIGETMSEKYNKESPWVYAAESSIHGRGLFAKKHIRKGTHIGTYEGPTTRRDGMHVLWVYDENDENPIGRNGKNVLRFCNHSRRPNAEFDGFELYAIRPIKKDEEITFHYGDDWENDE